MNLRDYLSILRDYWKSILAITAAAVLLGLGVFLVTGSQVTYIARTAVFLAPSQAGTALEVVGGADYASAQAVSFARLARMDVVLAPVVRQLDLPYTSQELANMVVTWSDASLVDIQVNHAEPEPSTVIARAIAEELVTTVREFTPVDGGGRGVLTATVVDPGGTAITAEEGLPLGSAIALGLLGGLVLGLVQAGLRAAWKLSPAPKTESV